MSKGSRRRPSDTAHRLTCQKGHTMTDKYGNCLRCGERVETPSQALREHAERNGGTIVTMSKTFRLTAEQVQLIKLARGEP